MHVMRTAKRACTAQLAWENDATPLKLAGLKRSVPMMTVTRTQWNKFWLAVLFLVFMQNDGFLSKDKAQDEPLGEQVTKLQTSPFTQTYE